MFCSNCGAEIAANAKFCSGCGATVNAEATPQPAPPVNASPLQTVPAQPEPVVPVVPQSVPPVQTVPQQQINVPPQPAVPEKTAEASGERTSPNRQEPAIFQPAMPYQGQPGDSNNQAIIMFCKECGSPLDEEARFCPNCGTAAGTTQSAPVIQQPVKNCCANCGASFKEGMVFCEQCGAKVGGEPATTTNVRQVIEAGASKKDYLTTLLLLIFLGSSGAHRFYVGKIGTGILMPLLMIVFAIFAFFSDISLTYADNYGDTSSGTFYLLIALPFGLAISIWWMVDLITIVRGKFRDKQGKLISRRKNYGV
ncbi:MAG: zinc-ribbon domain-containing protein [Spirochaetaceae bacterium]|jgi:TM2 domain-containing membrane protein YozV|nr:zinc-ribbon domain-containing protein [Spirochaetaceae bacterium]